MRNQEKQPQTKEHQIKESDGKITAEVPEPFNALVEPVKNEVALYNQMKKNEETGEPDSLTGLLSSILNQLVNSWL